MSIFNWYSRRISYSNIELQKLRIAEELRRTRLFSNVSVSQKSVTGITNGCAISIVHFPFERFQYYEVIMSCCNGNNPEHTRSMIDRVLNTIDRTRPGGTGPVIE